MSNQTPNATFKNTKEKRLAKHQTLIDNTSRSTSKLPEHQALSIYFFPFYQRQTPLSPLPLLSLSLSPSSRFIFLLLLSTHHFLFPFTTVYLSHIVLIAASSAADYPKPLRFTTSQTRSAEERGTFSRSAPRLRSGLFTLEAPREREGDSLLQSKASGRLNSFDGRRLQVLSALSLTTFRGGHEKRGTR